MIDPADQACSRLLGTAEPALLGPQRRSGTLSGAEIRAAVDDLCRPRGLGSTQHQAILSLGLLWHDHLEESHGISQGINNPDGSFIHAIMHRREPDYGNSKYWWRRTGAHPVFPGLGEHVSKHVQEAGATRVVDGLVRNGIWVPDAFVDACESVAGRSTEDPTVALLRKMQQLEFERLLGWLLNPGE